MRKKDDLITTTFRLSLSDKDKLDRIAEAHNLHTVTDALRLLIGREFGRIKKIKVE